MASSPGGGTGGCVVGQQVNEEFKQGAKFLQNLGEMLSEGAVTPEEGVFLCQAAKKILARLETFTDRRFVLFGLRAGISVLDWLEHDIGSTDGEI